MLLEVYKTVNYAGGIEHVLCNFANEFVQRGYEVSYVCLDKEKGVPFYPLDAKVQFINLCYTGANYFGVEYYLSRMGKEVKKAYLGKKKNLLGVKISDPKRNYFENQFISRLKAQLKITNPDIIICADSQGVYIAQEASNMSIPTIAMCHTDPEQLPTLPEKEVQAWKRAAVVQVLNAKFQDYFMKLGINKLVTIPNAVHIDQLTFSQQNNNCIICAARLEKIQKRPHLLLEAFGLVAKKFPEWKLVFCGEADSISYKKILEGIVEKYNLGHQVVFKGHVKNIHAYMSKADILVVPSSYEGFGLSLVEAMEMGLAVIGFENCSGINSIITNGDNGILSEDGVENLAKNIEKLIGNPSLRKKLGSNAKKMIDVYAPEKIWDLWEGIILKYAK